MFFPAGHYAVQQARPRSGVGQVIADSLYTPSIRTGVVVKPLTLAARVHPDRAGGLILRDGDSMVPSDNPPFALAIAASVTSLS